MLGASEAMGGEELTEAEECEQAIVALNSQFVTHLQALLRDRPNELWSSAVNMYSKHSASIRQRFPSLFSSNASPSPAARPRRAEQTGGEVLLCGAGDNGQLGLGDDIDEAPSLCRVPLSMNQQPVRILAVTCGGMHTLALSDSGDVFSWGVNDEGALGRSASKYSAGSESNPNRVQLPSGVTVSGISAGDSHSLALSSDGEVFGWGTFRNMNGRWRFSPSIEIATTPQRVQIGDGRERIESIASGSDHAIAITLSGTVFSWGTAEQGRLGRIAKAECGKKRPDEELVPKKVSGLPPISMASCGLFSTMVVGRDGDVFAWGGNNCGQIALEGEGPYHYPHHVDALGPCVQVACGQHHSLALTHEGQVLSFGRTTYGRLGREDANAKADDIKSTPAPVDGIDSKVISVSAGPEVSGAVTDDHTALVWGNGQNHQLGQGEDAEDDKLKPTILQLEENSKQRKALSIAFGGQHTAVMVSSRDSSLGKRESAWTGQEKENGPGKRARLS